MLTVDGFDYRTASSAQIQSRAQLLVRETPRTYAPSAASSHTTPSPHSKGVYGAYLEEYFGIPPNNRNEPDFPGAEVELKSVPIDYLKAGSARAVQRTKAVSLDPFEVLKHDWVRSDAHKKLARVLFVFYHRMRTGASYEDMPVLATCLWELEHNREDNNIWAADYEKIRGFVLAGMAHELSSRLTTSLHAHTSGKGELRRQPNSPIPMKQRSLGVKPPFASRLYLSLTGKLEQLEGSLRGLSGPALERELLSQLRKWTGREVGELRRSLKIKQSRRKDQVAFVVARSLGGKRRGYEIEELSRSGIALKTVPVSAAGDPQEAMSFPAFVPLDFSVEENFDESDFSDQIRRLLIVPHSGVRGGDTDRRVLRRAFVWSPSAEQLEGIAREWTVFRDLILAGGIERLPTAKSTSFIHVRPKGKDSSDVVEAPGAKFFQRSCFWLNKDFIKRILAENER